MKRLLFVATLIAASACLDDPRLEDSAFPCRAPEDCVDGFSCDPDRWICVPEGGAPAVDAGVSDAG